MINVSQGRNSVRRCCRLISVIVLLHSSNYCQRPLRVKLGIILPSQMYLTETFPVFCLCIAVLIRRKCFNPLARGAWCLPSLILQVHAFESSLSLISLAFSFSPSILFRAFFIHWITYVRHSSTSYLSRSLVTIWGVWWELKLES